MVEHGQSSKNKKCEQKLDLQGGISKKQFQEEWFSCGKKGNKYVDFKFPKKKNKSLQENIVATLLKMC